MEFPELGMDLFDAGRDMDNINNGNDVNRSFVVSVPDTSCQHNWLFRNPMSSEASVASTKMCPPVFMLVPNPAEVTNAQIGNKDFGLVSELSERFSVASFDVSNISSSDDMDSWWTWLWSAHFPEIWIKQFWKLENEARLLDFKNKH